MKKSIIIILTLSILFISGCKKTDKEIDNNKQDTNNTVTEPENNDGNNDKNQDQPIENLNKQLTFELTKMDNVDNKTTIGVKVKNISNETYANTSTKIILLDNQEKEIINFVQRIDEIKPNEEKIINLTCELDISKINIINYEIIN